MDAGRSGRERASAQSGKLSGRNTFITLESTRLPIRELWAARPRVDMESDCQCSSLGRAVSWLEGSERHLSLDLAHIEARLDYDRASEDLAAW